jgi:hypothetical protein
MRSQSGFTRDAKVIDTVGKTEVNCRLYEKQIDLTGLDATP